MEERPLDDPTTHNDLTPEGRRKAAQRGQLQSEIHRRVGPGTRFFAVLKRVFTGT